jgi:hypothetical protein
MNKLLIPFLIIAWFVFARPATIVSVKDFKPAFGKWKGSLTYLDYSSGKPYTMPVNVTIMPRKGNSNQLILAFEYPDEPKANGNDTLIINKDGTQIDGAAVISNKRSADRSLEIITEKAGEDGNDNRKATLRHIYTISKKLFSSRKEVKFSGEEKFILRNEYKMNR